MDFLISIQNLFECARCMEETKYLQSINVFFLIFIELKFKIYFQNVIS